MKAVPSEQARTKIVSSAAEPKVRILQRGSPSPASLRLATSPLRGVKCFQVRRCVQKSAARSVRKFIALL